MEGQVTPSLLYDAALCRADRAAAERSPETNDRFFLA
jgi:hypothetical protein